MIVALFAVDEIGSMGFEGRLPWPRNKEDMRWFKEVTENQLVVMGRNTWNSKDMPTPLPNRTNVLVTNTFVDDETIIQIRGDVPESLFELQRKFPNKNIYVIGGPDILMQAIPALDLVYVTNIPGEYHRDVSLDTKVFLKNFNLRSTKNLETCKIKEYEAIPRCP